jgi:predicted CopG family antitoxin
MVAKTISVADDVFEWLKTEKGGRSYSELLRQLKGDNLGLSQVAGQNALEDVSEQDMNEPFRQASEDSINKIEEKIQE